jgi:hypothetical protein
MVPTAIRQMQPLAQRQYIQERSHSARGDERNKLHLALKMPKIRDYLIAMFLALRICLASPLAGEADFRLQSPQRAAS